MEIDDEENFLTDKLLSARQAALDTEAHMKEIVSEARKAYQNAVKFQEDCEQAIIDYMLANGIRQYNFQQHLLVTIGKTSSVDIPDASAVPEMFMRIKLTKEPNLIMIKELKPDANWYSIKRGHTLTLKGM